MARSNIVIFGKRFAKPKGLRVSPGTNWFASCVGSSLYGKSGGGRGGVRARFIAAAKECRGKGGK